MTLFKKRKQPEEKTHQGKDKLAKGIAGFILTMQTGFARKMSRLTRKMPTSSMKVALVFFCMLGTGSSLYFIVKAVQKSAPGLIRIERISVPKYYNNTDESARPDVIVTKREHEEMQAFQRYMDSLHKNNTGKAMYDSIMMNRPGLLDSVNMLEEIYQSQLQNKK